MIIIPDFKLPKDIKKEIETIVPKPYQNSPHISVTVGSIDSDCDNIPADSLDRVELIFEDFKKELAKATGQEPENIRLAGIKLAYSLIYQCEKEGEYIAVAYREGYRNGFENLLRMHWDS